MRPTAVKPTLILVDHLHLRGQLNCHILSSTTTDILFVSVSTTTTMSSVDSVYLLLQRNSSIDELEGIGNRLI